MIAEGKNPLIGPSGLSPPRVESYQSDPDDSFCLSGGPVSWLEQLKPGDAVIVDRGRQGQDIEHVSRLTATQIILRVGQGESRYRKKDGKSLGASTWSINYLCEPTDMALAFTEQANRRRRLLAQMSQMDWSKLPSTTLEQIVRVASDWQDE